MHNSAHGAGTTRTRVLAGAACWTLSLVGYFAIQPIVAAAWPESYSYAHNAISDLGNTECGMFPNLAGGKTYVCSPRHAWMNGSFVVLGLFTAIGAWLTYPAWPRQRATTVGLALTAVAGLCVSGVGLAPENLDLTVHTVLALLQVPVQLFGMVLLTLVSWHRHRWRARWTLLCALAAVVGNVLLFSGNYLGLGVGGIERLALDSFTMWTGFLGIAFLVAHRGRGDREAGDKLVSG